MRVTLRAEALAGCVGRELRKVADVPSVVVAGHLVDKYAVGTWIERLPGVDVGFSTVAWLRVMKFGALYCITW